MTEQEILDKIASEGWSILLNVSDSFVGEQIQQDVRKVLLYKSVNDIAVNKTIRYVKYSTNECYWWEKNEFPEAKPVSFVQELQTFLSSFIPTTAKFAVPEKIDQANERAIIAAIRAVDGSFQTYLVTKDGNGDLQAEPVDYPVGGSSV